MSRDYIKKDEGKLTVLQFLGFMMMIASLILMVLFSFIQNAVSPYVVSISFFATMLGFSFAFPSLLEGNDGLSTMRIIVFMITNVICMLLLKIGWSVEITSLKDIGLDQYWMGVIAFVFGAKAVQSFFESKLAVPKNEPKELLNGMSFNNAETAKLAVLQNEQFLKVKYSNIASISDAVDDIYADKYVVAIYLKDNNKSGIPEALNVKMPDGSIARIPTEIIDGVDEGGIHLNQNSLISNGLTIGSICCIVEAQGVKCAVTAGHVYSKGFDKDAGGILDDALQSMAHLDTTISGKWIFQVIDSWNDIALASFEEVEEDMNYISFKNNQHYIVQDTDIKNTKVQVISAVGNRIANEAFILDYNTAWDVRYRGGKVTKSNIIVIGTTPDRNTSTCVSQPGDSGGCVYVKEKGLVGLILGGNSKFTWVLPVKDIFDTYNFKLT